jgi:hypothetical protein
MNRANQKTSFLPNKLTLNLNAMRLFLINLSLLFYCTAINAEMEPNDHCNEANPIQPGEFISGNFDRMHDRDFYRFHVSQGGTYVFTVSGADASETIHSTIYYLNDCNGGLISIVKPSGLISGSIHYIFDTGTYYFSLQEGNNKLNLNFYTFNIKLINDDIFEVNNSFENASLISIDSLYVAYLLGNYYFGNFHNFNDIDYYKLFIPAKGILKINLPLVPHDPDFIIKVSLYDSLYNFITRDCICGNTSLVEYLQTVICDAGTYYILIESNEKQSYSPYHFIARFIPDSTECNEEPESAFHLENTQTISAYSGGISSSTLENEIDWYSFEVAEEGVFNLSIERADTFIYEIVLYNQKKEEVIRTNYTFSLGLAAFKDYALCETGKYYLSLSDRTANPCGVPHKSRILKYQLKLQNVFPDIYECNNKYSTATPISTNALVCAALASYRDTDLYRIFLYQYDTLILNIDSIPESFPYEAAILTYSGIHLFKTNYSESGRIYFVNKQPPGYFYLRLANLSLLANNKYCINLETHSFLTSVDGIVKNHNAALRYQDTGILQLSTNKHDEFRNANYFIINSLGIVTQAPTKLPDDLKLDINNLPAGVYHFIIGTRLNDQYHFKFLKL